MMPESSSNSITILNVQGPFREPREPVFSYDYSAQRPTWPTPHGVRVKVSIPDELDPVKNAVLPNPAGSPGQQLRINQILSRLIADAKFSIAEGDGLLSQRQDVLIGPFTGSMAHLFPLLQQWMREQKDALRQEIRQKVGV